MIAYALQVGSKQDRLFTTVERAIEEAKKFIEAETGEFKHYKPDDKYYFYAMRQTTMTRVKVKQTIIEE